MFDINIQYDHHVVESCDSYFVLCTLIQPLHIIQEMSITVNIPLRILS